MIYIKIIKFFPFFILILLIVCEFENVLTQSETVISVDKLKFDYVNFEKNLWKKLDYPLPFKKHLTEITESHESFIKNNLKIINFEPKLHSILSSHNEWQLLRNNLIIVDGEFNFFTNTLKNFNNLELFNDNNLIFDFVHKILGDMSIKKQFDLINWYVNSKNMFTNAVTTKQNRFCKTNQSVQYYLYLLYSDVGYVELKGYIMLQYALMILKIQEKELPINPEDLRKTLIEQLKLRTQLFHKTVDQTDQIMWKCDPAMHIKGKTYDEVTNLFQGYIVNEKDMNEDDTCRENCKYYELSKFYSRCYDENTCSQHSICRGKIMNCTFIESDMEICLESPESNRRYKYIEYESGKVLGEKQYCSKGTTKVQSWYRYLIYHCSYCFCICDEEGTKSDRYFNLRSVESDVEKNMVVTGIRFIKVNRIFHLQIQQGELLPFGHINHDSLNWKSVDSYRIFDRTVRSGKDYFTMNWNKKTIDLDDIVKPKHVLTGVRFRILGEHLNLEGKFSEFNFESGKLIDAIHHSEWHSNDNTEVYPNHEEKRREIFLNKPDIPTRSSHKSVPTSTHNQYIKFSSSDMDKDAAQTTVPFIDTQELVTIPAIPLSGVGIFWKGRDGFGGFIAPKLITYNFLQHMETPFK